MQFGDLQVGFTLRGEVSKEVQLLGARIVPERCAAKRLLEFDDFECVSFK